MSTSSHRDTFEKSHLSFEHGVSVAKSFTFPVKSNSQCEVKANCKEVVDIKDRPVCFYCKKHGHIINQCFALNKRNTSPKAVNLMKTETLPEQQPLSKQSTSAIPDLDVYAPFIMKGFVSLSEDPKIPDTMLRDSAATQSVILEGVLPFSDKTCLF